MSKKPLQCDSAALLRRQLAQNDILKADRRLNDSRLDKNVRKQVNTGKISFIKELQNVELI
jgi:hypothetical protein